MKAALSFARAVLFFASYVAATSCGDTSTPATNAGCLETSVTVETLLAISRCSAFASSRDKLPVSAIGYVIDGVELYGLIPTGSLRSGCR